MRADLIIFDCDGVLVDSEIIAIEIEGELLREAGFEIGNDEIAERFVGLSYPDMMRIIAEEHGRQVPVDLQQKIRDFSLAAFPDRLQAVQGIDDLLKRSMTRRCVASSSKLDRITLSLDTTGLLDHFQPGTLYSTQFVERGKPAPDIFLHAAEQQQTDPSRCTVIEDSPYGVAGAVAAGMTVVGFVGGLHCTPGLDQRLMDAGATDVVSTAGELTHL